MTEILLWAGYFAVFAFLVHKGRSKDAVLSGSVGFGVQAFAYVATYISAVALVGFGGLAHAYGLQMLLVAAGNVWFGTWAVYRFLAWPTRKWQERLGARTPAQLLGLGHGSPNLTRAMAFVFALFLGDEGAGLEPFPHRGDGGFFTHKCPIPPQKVVTALAPKRASCSPTSAIARWPQ